MGIYKVRLGVARGARNTSQRFALKVLADSRLSAAITAERVGDTMLRDPSVEYTHAISVRKMANPKPIKHPAMAMAMAV